MSEPLKLGQIIDDQQQRDAIHIAVAPVVATEKLYPGQDIGFVAGCSDAGPSEKPIGIVDPFLKGPVFFGQRFWMFLYPNTITSLRHNWTHPAFLAVEAAAVAVPDKEVSEAWLRDFARRIGIDYEEAIQAGTDRSEIGTCHTFQGHDTPSECYDECEEYWRHFEVVTGKKVDDDTRGYAPFSCSC